MAITGTVLALDLSTNTGFAIGAPGTKPRSGTVVLKDPEDDAVRAARNLACFIRDQIAFERPELVVYEAPLPVAAMRANNNAGWTIAMAWQLVGAVNAICGPYGIRTVAARCDTVRKHFIGQANCGNRKDTKQAVINRCHVLDLMPKKSRDDNRADAIATWDWACTTYGGKSPSSEKFALFGQVSEAAE